MNAGSEGARRPGRDVEILVRRGDGADPGLPLPEYETEGAAGFDLRACFPDRDPVSLGPGERMLVPTGLHFEIPDGYEVQVRPRSGLALRKGLAVLNSPGTIDSDYRGPLGVVVVNSGSEAIEISHGDRIAQGVVAPVIRARFVETDSLGETERGAGGFGSTGVSEVSVAPGASCGDRARSGSGSGSGSGSVAGSDSGAAEAPGLRGRNAPARATERDHVA